MNAILESCYSGALADLRVARDGKQLKAVQSKAHAVVDQIFGSELERSGMSIACKSGCCFCCYLKVDIHPSEAFLIADYVRANFSPEQKRTVEEKARENWTKIEPMTLDQHFGSNLPCPLLFDGKCSVYAVRPSGCRMFHAQTVRTCKESFDHPEDLSSPNSEIPDVKIATASAQSGVNEAYKQTGHDAEAYDLNPALVEALTNPKSERRWRDGKTAFPKNMRSKKPPGASIDP
jgi:Fe-S-cluster containining protein